MEARGNGEGALNEAGKENVCDRAEGGETGASERGLLLGLFRTAFPVDFLGSIPCPKGWQVYFFRF